MSDPTPVTVIGLGPMGRAMARAYLDRGHATTVFNRTPSRADALVADGRSVPRRPPRRSTPARSSSSA